MWGTLTECRSVGGLLFRDEMVERDFFFFSDLVRFADNAALPVEELEVGRAAVSDAEALMGGDGRGKLAAGWLTSGEEDFLWGFLAF